MAHEVTEPLRSTMADGGGGKNQVISTFLAGAGGPEYSGKPRPIDAPAATQTTENHAAVFATFLAQNNTGVIGHAVTEPVSTMTGTCSHQTLVAGAICTHYGSDQDTKLQEPLPTATTKDRFALTESALVVPPLTPEREVMARRVAAFLREHGIVFEGEFARTKSGLIIYDIGLRMLQPKELYAAQGFPADYIIEEALIEEVDGTRVVKKLAKHEQVRMCGNSVCPPVAAALVRANVPHMAAWEHGEEQARVA